MPKVADAAWARQPFDRFVLAKLEAANLTPSPEVDRATWLRRVCLTLTGLPPTPGDQAAFLADPSADAYERVVDRLLAAVDYRVINLETPLTARRDSPGGRASRCRTAGRRRGANAVPPAFP